jgi:uncharacterized membrane protein YbhN (UPF0104 family)
MIKKYFGIIVTTVFLFLFVYYLIEEPKFLEILSTTKPSIIFAILSLSFIRICLISVQNIFLFRILNINLTFKEAFKIVYINRAGNQLLPLKLGSGYKAHYFIKKLNVPTIQYLYLNAGQFAVSLIVTFIIFFISVNLSSNFYSENFLNLINILLSFLVFLGIFTYVLIFYLNTKNKLDEKSIYYKIYSGLKILITANRNQFLFLITTISIILLNIYMLFYISDMYVLNSSIYEASKLYSAGVLSTLVQITPGNIGVSEAVLIYLQDLYIFKTSEILAISLVGRTTELLLLIILNFFVKKDDQ